jgi:hypothetical protein
MLESRATVSSNFLLVLRRRAEEAFDGAATTGLDVGSYHRALGEVDHAGDCAEAARLNVRRLA